MNISKLVIIGGGNLGVSIAEGLLSSGLLSPEKLVVTRRNADALSPLGEKGVHISSSNADSCEGAELILLCVKPWQVGTVISEISPALTEGSILVSCASGVPLSEIEEASPDGVHAFRAMPNTAISVKESMTCISGNSGDKSAMANVKSIFDALGTAIIINEELMDAATVLAACGIAYCLRFIRATSQGGIEIGFSSDVAQTIAAQTAKGAASLLLQHNSHPESEIDKVTTPKGCTIAGLNEMEHQGFSSALIKGIKTSFDKI
jgi:pyrroline-5-carboxylate reductase